MREGWLCGEAAGLSDVASTETRDRDVAGLQIPILGHARTRKHERAAERLKRAARKNRANTSGGAVLRAGQLAAAAHLHRPSPAAAPLALLVRAARTRALPSDDPGGSREATLASALYTARHALPRRRPDDRAPRSEPDAPPEVVKERVARGRTALAASTGIYATVARAKR
ncbi:hypothetical protein HPB52_019854 [Rhipicephalus sanguineus]|uniref:Uncharacterized protein n=1 Tax=Rhipicephalus sanguineus TaxID=34632 RepID=A0A9D4PUV9_RHISA|nr:hypothetical protein HPB52_019854 [Rhipicephalus sanguineus]